MLEPDFSRDVLESFTRGILMKLKHEEIKILFSIVLPPLFMISFSHHQMPLNCPRCLVNSNSTTDNAVIAVHHWFPRYSFENKHL